MLERADAELSSATDSGRTIAPTRTPTAGVPRSVFNVPVTVPVWEGGAGMPCEIQVKMRISAIISLLVGWKPTTWGLGGICHLPLINCHLSFVERDFSSQKNGPSQDGPFVGSTNVQSVN
jgi:hypothetical protein